ncbi:MAG: 50S ribosomal protein L24 [Planctomycetaceae bacterium]
MLIKAGDTVEVRTGNSRGTRAKVLSVMPASRPGAGGRVVVEGVNRVYRHMRRSQKNQQGGRLSKEMPIAAANVLLVCASCGKATRLGAKAGADGGKVRFCRRCGAEQGVLRRPKGAKARA